MALTEPKAGAASTVAEPSRDGQSAVSRRFQLLAFRLLNSRWQFALVLVALLPVLGAIAWYFSRSEGPSPKAQLAEALAALDRRDDADARARALRIAESLAQSHYADPEFPGALEFILGIVAFRDAAGLDGQKLDEQYAFAAKYLREAETRTLDAAWRPEWAFALGTCLDHAGAPSQAQPLLELAYKEFEPGRVEAALRLTRIYLDLRTPEFLAKALELNTRLLAGHALNADRRDAAWLMQAQVFLALDRLADAERALGQLSPWSSRKQAALVVKAEMLIAQQKHREALALLEPVAVDVTATPASVPRKASFLQGVCAEALGDAADAIRYFERTAQRDGRSPEGIAANVRAAELLRRSGRHEEALDAWRKALSALARPDEYRNHWLSVTDARRIVLEAWNDWIQQEKFDEAIGLSKVMPPLIPKPQAAELTARAHQLAAEALERRLETATQSARTAHESERLERWRRSGKAHYELAELIRTTSQYPDALWNCAEHFRRGYDFDRALVQLDRFISTRPASLLPLALVRRGEILMDLDRQDEALTHFRKVIENHATDAAAFEARYLIGQCQLERGELDRAEAAWRAVVKSPQLSPAANEWRLSLFSLGRLLYHRVTARLAEFTRSDRQAETTAGSPPLAAVDRDCSEALRRLDEYAKRYPASPEIVETRFMLAKLLHCRADILSVQSVAAETDNARAEFRKQRRHLLTDALELFLTLREELRVAAANDRLDPLGHQLLQSCFFEIGHTQFGLEAYEQAIAAYTIAMNRYSQDPRVLLAYLQMSDAYERLGRIAESRAILEQARVALKQFPADTFRSSASNLDSTEWDQWLNWARRLHISADAGSPET